MTWPGIQPSPDVVVICCLSSCAIKYRRDAVARAAAKGEEENADSLSEVMIELVRWQ